MYNLSRQTMHEYLIETASEEPMNLLASEIASDTDEPADRVSQSLNRLWDELSDLSLERSSRSKLKNLRLEVDGS